MHNYKKTRGFSLLEFLLVCSLMVVLLAWAWPGFKGLLQGAESESLLNQLKQALDLARNQALVRHEVVSLRYNQAELEIFLPQGETLFLFPLAKQEGRLSSRFFPKEKSSLSFLPNGNTDSQNGRFCYYPKDKTLPSWVVIVSKTGRMRTLTNSLV